MNIVKTVSMSHKAFLKLIMTQQWVRSGPPTHGYVKGLRLLPGYGSHNPAHPAGTSL